MGALISRLLGKFSKEARILMLGLDAAGKTTVLNKMKFNEVQSTIPTVGFNVEEITYKNLTMNIWDVGGQHKIRKLWRHYYQNTNGLIYVVDSADRERVEEAKEELMHIMADDMMRDVPVLVFANKADLPSALSVGELARSLDLKSLRSKWFVQASSAVSGQGLAEGFDWMASELKERL